MKLAENTIVSPQINLVPILDSIFILVFVFMMALMQKVHKSGIKLSLPSATQNYSKFKTEAVTISINDKGLIFLENKELSKDLLKKELELLRLENYNAPISLQGEKTANLGLVIDILDLLKTNGFRNVTIETSLKK